MSGALLTNRRHHGIDALRALAALLVCAGHLRAATLVDLADVSSPGLVTKALYALTSLGHQAVMVFFVLSGYLVGGSVLSCANRFTWRPYMQARLSRLWTVLLPCLALTWAIDQVVLHVAPQVYGGDYAALWHSAPMPGQYDASWLTCLGNVFFLQTVAVPVFGSNGPLWSLANEFWYYLLFPAMWQAGMTRTPLAQRLLAGTLALGVLCAMPGEMRLGFLVWLMGVGAFWLRGRSVGPFALVLLMFLGGIILSKWSGTRAWTVPWGDLVLGACTSLLVLRATAGRAAPWPRWIRIPVERLSDLSFSLYLSHFPLVMLIGATGYMQARMQPGFATWCVYAAWLLGLVACGQGVWWLFERHTPRVRQWMSCHIPFGQWQDDSRRQ